MNYVDDGKGQLRREFLRELNFIAFDSHPDNLFEMTTISVFVRGDISNKIYAIWEQKIRSFVDTEKTVLINYYDPLSTDIIITSKGASLSSVAAWMNIAAIDFPDHVVIVTDNWMFESIKHHAFQSTEAFTILPTTSKLPIVPALPCGSAQATSIAPSPITASFCDKTDKIGEMKSKLACSLSGTEPAAKTNPNKHITGILEKLQTIYDLTGDDYRSKSYKGAIAKLSQAPLITDTEQVKSMFGVGTSIRGKIDEILETGTLAKLEAMERDPKLLALISLCDIWGVGIATARKLYSTGYKSVEDLRDRGRHLLSKPQLVGLDRLVGQSFSCTSGLVDMRVGELMCWFRVGHAG